MALPIPLVSLQSNHLLDVASRPLSLSSANDSAQKWAWRQKPKAQCRTFATTTTSTTPGVVAVCTPCICRQRQTTVERLIEVARTGSTSTPGSAVHAIGNIGQRRAEENREAAPFAGAGNVILAALDDADPDVRK